MAEELPTKMLTSDQMAALKKFLDEAYPNHSYLDIGHALTVYFYWVYRTVLMDNYGYTARSADVAVHALIAHGVRRLIDSYEATVAVNISKENIN